MLKVRELNDFEEMKDSWDILLEKSRVNTNIFLTWEWLSTWWKHFGKGRKPLILLVEDEQKVLAVAPLMLSEYKLPLIGKMQRVEFIGSPASDYNDFIVLDKEAECLKLILAYLKSNTPHWNWIELKEVKETTGTMDDFRYLAPELLEDFKIEERTCNICPYITLPNSFESLMNSLTKNMRQNLNKYMRKINQKYDVKLKKYDDAGFTVETGMRTFVSLHQKKWASEGFPGNFEEGRRDFLNFHLDVAQSFADKGWLGLYFLMANNEPIAAQYTFKYNRKMLCYLTGFDPAYSEYSAGNLLTMFLLRECIIEGFNEYDMMRGDEAYKTRWTDKYVRNYEVRFVRKDFSSRFYNWVTWSKAVNSLGQKLGLSVDLSQR
jgi:CelD/BcsL family acetyltransferase involved in cellulose biosynthesis